MTLPDMAREARLRRRLKRLGFYLEKQRSRKFRGEWWVYDEAQGCQTVLRLPSLPAELADERLACLETWLDECEVALLSGRRPKLLLDVEMDAQRNGIDAEWAAQ